MINNLAYSKTGLHLTEQFESCPLKAYLDIGGIWTVAYGHTLGVHEGMTCTPEQAEKWLMQDVQSAANAVNRMVRIKLSQSEFDSLTDFVFNVGISAFHSSDLLRQLNAGNIQAAADQFPRWDHVSGIVVKGLLERRLAEQKEFLS